MSLKHGPKPAAPSIPDHPSKPEAASGQTAASLAACAAASLGAPVAAEAMEPVDLGEVLRVKQEQELEEDLHQDLEDLRLKRIAQALDAKEAQLRLAIYRDELFRAGLRKELESLIGFLTQKLGELPSVSSGRADPDDVRASESYLKGLLGSACRNLDELGG